MHAAALIATRGGSLKVKYERTQLIEQAFCLFASAVGLKALAWMTGSVLVFWCNSTTQMDPGLRILRAATEQHRNSEKQHY